MDLVTLKYRLFDFWNQYLDLIIVIGGLVIAFYSIYHLLKFAAKKNFFWQRVHERLSKIAEIILSIWSRIFAILLFLFTLFIVVTIIVKFVLFFWSL